MLYLATPFRCYPGPLGSAWAAACEQAALFVRAKIPVFSPIAHSYGIAHYGILDARADWWLEICAPFMKRCDAMVFCKLPSWEKSEGMAYERRCFEERGLPVYEMEPGELPVELWQ